jgi:hypothetical protein
MVQTATSAQLVHLQEKGGLLVACLVSSVLQVTRLVDHVLLVLIVMLVPLAARSVRLVTLQVLLGVHVAKPTSTRQHSLPAARAVRRTRSVCLARPVAARSPSPRPLALPMKSLHSRSPR